MTARFSPARDGSVAYTEDARIIGDQGAGHDAGYDLHVGSIQFDSGYLSPFFVTHPERMEVALENAYILIHKSAIDSGKDLVPLLEQVTKNGKPLLIIAGDVGSAALSALVVGKLRGALQVVAVKAPGAGDQSTRVLQEIARLTRGKTIGEGLEVPLKSAKISDLGQARKIFVDKNVTVVEGRLRLNEPSFEA